MWWLQAAEYIELFTEKLQNTVSVCGLDMLKF